MALFHQTPDWSDRILQKIAREMNLSETVFLYPEQSPTADFRMRIFTPEKEIPFAGHPIIGTAFALFNKGLAGQGKKQVKLKLPAGIISVEMKSNGICFMRQPQPKFLDRFEDLQLIAKSLGIQSEQISLNSPCQAVSTGFPCLFVPINKLNTLNKIEINSKFLAETLQKTNVDMLYVFSKETVCLESTVHSRSFAPFIGIPEDPATGSAGGALGAYLLNYGIAEPGKMEIEQGYEIDRPSRIYLDVSNNDSEWIIEVGGKCVFIIEGNIRI